MLLGLNIVPGGFTKLSRPILRELRTKGVKVFMYLGDGLIYGNSKKEYLRSTDYDPDSGGKRILDQ